MILHSQVVRRLRGTRRAKMVVHAVDGVQRGGARMIGVYDGHDAAMVVFRGDEISCAIDPQYRHAYVRPELRDKFLVERNSRYSELRNFGLFPCNQVGQAFLQVHFFAHRYLIGDTLFAALDFECGFLAHS